MLNRSASLAMSTSVLKTLPGKLDIKRHSPSILYIANKDCMTELCEHRCVSEIHCYGNEIQCMSNTEKVTHIKGRLLDQAVILFNRVPFSKWELLLKERICSQRE